MEIPSLSNNTTGNLKKKKIILFILAEAGRSIDKDDDGTVCCKCHRADQPELVPHDAKEILKDILMHIHKKLKAKDVKGFFAEPITDTIAPGYSDNILDPMDFSTMESKIERNEYGSIMGYKKDFELMCKNAMTYNRPVTIYYKEAKRLLRLLQGCVEQRIKVPVVEKGFLKEILLYIHKKLKAKDVNEFFGDPITNTIAQGYSDIIREPIDFSTMESKIEMNEYGSIMDYKKDFVLMCENAMTYNSREKIYYKEANRLLRLLQGCIEQRIKWRRDNDDIQVNTEDESESGSSKSSYSDDSEESSSGFSDSSEERVRPGKKARRDERRARRRTQKERSCRSKKPNYKEPDELTMDVVQEDVSSLKASRTKTDKHQGVGPKKQLSTSSTSSQETLYRWDKATSLRNMTEHPKRTEEEKEKLLKWLRLRLVYSYHTDIYPSRHAHSLYPMEEILFSERFSNSVTVELCNELTKNKSNNNSEILVRCIDGASREVIKYKEFVNKAIIAISNIRMYKEIFFIISVDRSDEIDTLSDLLPDNVIESQVFTAFNPEKVQPSCILIHIKGIGLQTLTCT